LSGAVGVANGGYGSGTASIYADGKLVWKSAKSLTSEPQDFSISLESVKELRLEITASQGRNGGAWTTWFQPTLTR
jgi:hypothetical protein